MHRRRPWIRAAARKEVCRVGRLSQAPLICSVLSYVDGLRDRAESLRHAIHESRPSELDGVVGAGLASALTPSHSLPKVSPNYSGSGSIFRYYWPMGYLH